LRHGQSRLAKVDDAPGPIGAHGILEALAQEAHVVGIVQVVEGDRVAAEFAVIQPHGAGVLLAAVDGFDLLVPADLLPDGGSDGRQPNRQQRQKQHHHQQHVAGLSVAGWVAANEGTSHTAAYD
jgi:hypothetical protein